MELKLHEIEEGQSRVEAEVPAQSVGIQAQDVELEGPIRVALSLDRRGDEIWIRGTLHAIALQQCSRCLVDFSQILELEFEVFCAKLPSAPRAWMKRTGGSISTTATCSPSTAKSENRCC